MVPTQDCPTCEQAQHPLPRPCKHLSVRTTRKPPARISLCLSRNQLPSASPSATFYHTSTCERKTSIPFFLADTHLLERFKFPPPLKHTYEEDQKAACRKLPVRKITMPTPTCGMERSHPSPPTPANTHL